MRATQIGRRWARELKVTAATCVGGGVPRKDGAVVVVRLCAPQRLTHERERGGREEGVRQVLTSPSARTCNFLAVLDSSPAPSRFADGVVASIASIALLCSLQRVLCTLPA